MTATLAVIALTLSMSCPGRAYEVSEVGSFHVGGRQVTLTGLPEREIVFTAGAQPLKRPGCRNDPRLDG